MKGHIIASALLIGSLVGCAGTNLNAPLDGWVELHGHRGARGLSPENTLPSFEVGFKLGMTAVELDVVLTSDDQLIIHHNTSTNPDLCMTLKGDRIKETSIRTLTVKNLKELDCGSKFNQRFPEQQLVPGTQLPTLQEFFVFVRDYEAKHPPKKPMHFNVELKLPKGVSPEDVEKTAQVVVQVIEDAQVVDRALVQSFHTPVLPQVIALNSTIRTAALYTPNPAQRIELILGRPANSFELIEKSLALGVDIIAPHYLYVTEEFVREVHRKKLKVIPWTVNEADVMRTLLKIGVDGIISDYPDRLTEANRQHQTLNR